MVNSALPRSILGHAVPTTNTVETDPATAMLHPSWEKVRQDASTGTIARSYTCDVEAHDPDGSATTLVATT